MSGAPPAYDTSAYWEARFASDIASGTQFEWLGTGADTLLPPFVQYLTAHVAPPDGAQCGEQPRRFVPQRASSDQTVSPQAQPDPIRCLNIGCGSSALHVLTGAAWLGAHLPRRDYWNLDYAASAIVAARQLEPPGQEQESMRYVVGDLLDWEALVRQLQSQLSAPRSTNPTDASEEKEGPVQAVTDSPRPGAPVLFDIILDKSTSDAIATGPDVVFGEAEDMEEMLSMLQQGTSSSSASGRGKKDASSESSTESTAVATAEACCPLFPPEWYALHMPGSDTSFQRYLDYLALHSQSDPHSSLHSFSLSSASSASHPNSHTASNNALSSTSLSDKKTSPHRALPRSGSSRDDSARPAVLHSDTGERETSSALSSESAESAPKSQPAASGSGESGRSGVSNANSNSTSTRTSSGSSKVVHRVDPLVVLATHLAALVRPGGVWLIMSYSSDRCAFLERPLRSPYSTPFARRHPRAPSSTPAPAQGASAHPTALHHPSDFWTLENTQAVPVTSETGSAPPIFHHRYVLRRLPGPTAS